MKKVILLMSVFIGSVSFTAHSAMVGDNRLSAACTGAGGSRTGAPACITATVSSLPTMVVGDSGMELGQEEAAQILRSQALNYMDELTSNGQVQGTYSILDSVAAKLGITSEQAAQDIISAE